MGADKNKPKINKVKITVRELVDSEAALDYISKHPLRGKLTYRLGVVRRTIKPFLESFTDAKNNLVEKYGVKNKETKRPEVLPGSKNWKEFSEEIEKIGTDEIEFEAIEVTVAELEEKVGLDDDKEAAPWLTGEVCGDLFWLIKE